MPGQPTKPPRHFPNPAGYGIALGHHRLYGRPQGKPLLVPVWRQLLADKLTPVAAYELLTSGDHAPFAFLLESVVGGERVGRYSFLGVDPSQTYELRPGHNAVETDAAGTRDYPTADPLADLRRLLGHDEYVSSAYLAASTGFTGGLVGYAAYDLVRYYEPDKLGGPAGGPPDDRDLPDVVFGRFDDVVVFDHVDKTLRVISHARVPPAFERREVGQAYLDACARVDAIVEKLSQLPAVVPSDINTAGAPDLSFTQNLTREQYEDGVRRGIDYIRAGDVFQFVPSVRLRVQSHARPFDVYRALRVINPSPFMLYLKTPTCTLVGNSPEILCRVRGRTAVTRPLAGTRPRGHTPAADDRLADELLADPKERAEHVMLVDLHRNDLGRVAKVGTVTVDDLMSVERYSHVMHISSGVTATLADDADALDALRVSLPVGTVSGAPKIRAMQIIDELEPTRRGPYGGAVGHLDFTGDMDTCIALRTLVWQNGVYDVQAGAGVVADSQPAREYDECMAKARAMLRAVSVAESFL